MADDIAITLGDGGATVGADEISSVKYQRVKLIQGANGVNDGDICSAAPLQVTLANHGANTTAVKVNVASGGIASGGIASGAIADMLVDDAAFTAATSRVMPVGGIVTADSVDSGDVGAFAMLANRQQKITLYDSSGNEISVGGATQYTEDAAAAADPVGNIMIGVRRDTLNASEVSTDGDNIALKATNKGQLHTALASGAVASGAIASGAIASGAIASGAIASGAVASGAIVDGAMVTMGSKTDAKSTATDTTSVSGISIWKQISASVQSLVTASPVLGAATGANCVPTVPATDYNSVVTVTTQFTRPNDTNAYAAEDMISDSTSAPTSGGFTLTGCSRASGTSGIILDAMIGMSTKAGTALQGEVWIFDTSVTNVNDNSPFSISDPDRDKLVAILPFTANASGGLNYAAHLTNLNIGFTCVGSANLRYLVKAINAYTPAAQEVVTVRLKILQVN